MKNNRKLADLKREIKVGSIIKIIHDNALYGNIFGMTFRVTHATTHGFYYVCNDRIRENSVYDYSRMNNGKGAYLEYGSARQWEFGEYNKSNYNRKHTYGSNGEDIGFIILK